MDPNYQESCQQIDFCAPRQPALEQGEIIQQHQPQQLQQLQPRQQQQPLQHYDHHKFPYEYMSRPSHSLHVQQTSFGGEQLRGNTATCMTTDQPGCALMQGAVFTGSASVLSHPSVQHKPPTQAQQSLALEAQDLANNQPTTPQTQVQSLNVQANTQQDSLQNQRDHVSSSSSTTPTIKSTPLSTQPQARSGVTTRHSLRRTARPALTERQLFTALNLAKKTTRKRKVKSPSSSSDLPSCLSYQFASENKENVRVVVAKEMVEKGKEFGPYDGTLMDEELGAPKETTWELCLTGKVFFYIDGKKNNQQTWMSHVKFARTEEEQNVEAFQYYGEIYFRTTKVVEPGSELRVSYSEEYASRVGFKTKLKNLKYNKGENNSQCSLCKNQFTSSKLLLRHFKSEHSSDSIHEMLPVVTWKLRTKKTTSETQEEVLVCTMCGKSFLSEETLQAHESSRECREEHSCPVCGETQANAQSLKMHVTTHVPRPHQCNECVKSYMSKKALNKHKRNIHGMKLVVREHGCRICSAKFAKKVDCTKHEKTHREYKEIVATEKAQARFQRSDYGSRIGEEGENDSTNDSSQKKKKVIERPDFTEPRDMLGKASDYYTKPRPHKCRYCSKRYFCRKATYEHEKEVHEGKGLFRCTCCPKFFMNKNRFLDHLKYHEQNRFYRCTLCPRTFASESALNNHQGEHTGLKPFKCEICGRGFRIRKGVAEHKRRVHQVRQLRFFCSFCKKGFAEKDALKKHERRHKGIRPYVCLTCGRGFTERSTLTAHIQCRHTEEKPYSCEICGKKFSLNQNYTYHMFKHKAQAEDILPTSTTLPEEIQLH